ncbi:hypothetical protein F5Y17DRAFT_136853 [Xylariaceae sp. FL0594]|nr:hypothetical protein F5Y17DRAFT_136853 [Xylariaceae sp. FL0594]
MKGGEFIFFTCFNFPCHACPLRVGSDGNLSGTSTNHSSFIMRPGGMGRLSSYPCGDKGCKHRDLCQLPSAHSSVTVQKKTVTLSSVPS